MIPGTVSFSEALTAMRSRGRGTVAPWLWSHLRGLWITLQGGGNTLYDLSGYGNYGTLTNLASSPWVVGEQGYGIDFAGDNSGDYIQLANKILLPSGNPWTISCWADVDTLFNFGGLFGHLGTGSSRTRMLFGSTTNTLYSDDNTALWSLASTVQTGLHHYAWTRDGIDVLGYRDGKFLLRAAADPKAMTVFRLGNYGLGTTSGDSMDGRGLSWAVHDRTLRASEIQQLQDPFLMVRPQARWFPAAVVGGALAVTEDTFQNVEPFDNDESIDTVLATGGTTPYAWEIISQDLL